MLTETRMDAKRRRSVRQYRVRQGWVPLPITCRRPVDVRWLPGLHGHDSSPDAVATVARTRREEGPLDEGDWLERITPRL